MKYFSFISSRKGIVSITTYTLIIFLMVVLFFGVFSFYNNTKLNAQNAGLKLEIMNSLLTFRSDLLNLAVFNNSNISYFDRNYDLNLIVYLENKTITGAYLTDTSRVEVNISTLGLRFCDKYSVSFESLKIFSNNGSCVMLVS